MSDIEAWDTEPAPKDWYNQFKDELNPGEDYFIFMFDEAGAVTGFAAYEEYDGWWSRKYSVLGSTLSDANSKMSYDEFINWVVAYRKNLEGFDGYALNFSTNNERYCNEFLGVQGISVPRLDVEHSLTIEMIDEQARLHYNECVSMFGGQLMPDGTTMSEDIIDA